MPATYTFHRREMLGFASIEAINEAGFSELGGPKEVAHRLGKGKSQVYAYLKARSSKNRARFAFADALELTRAGALTWVRELCAAAGGCFMPGKSTNDALPALLSRLSRDHGDMVAEAFQALDDGKITRAEGHLILKAIDRLIVALTSLRARVLAAVEQAND